MKNVMVIDGALNCNYPIYGFTDEEFLVVFPETGQDLEFIDDAIARVGREELGRVLGNVWKRPVNRSEAMGIQGTLMYEMSDRKEYFPTKRMDEVINYR